MSTKEKLIKRLLSKPTPRNFTEQELDSLMQKCGCKKGSGGRGSAIKYISADGRILIFDGPHPGNEIPIDKVKLVIDYLKEIGEIKE